MNKGYSGVFDLIELLKTGLYPERKAQKRTIYS